MITKTGLRLWMALTLALLAGACTSYKYIPPASEAGRQCVVACATNQQICISGKEQLAASQMQICEMRRATYLSTCLSTAVTPQARDYCNRTVPHCSSSANTSACEAPYRACYMQCGGQVIEVKD